ncbi:hypothetical protein B1F69_19320 [Pseudomonas syringae]|uniref:hypothetical protein n=1 Tax=Pseudomonas syringae TaxID=317 RepID=UPI001010EA33|nr:hypothetical protein [Pseudomonas syringae]MCH5508877.1 hypothetical protein [Pseudomonas syringae pv. syringae]MCH7426753.1 hypothetical protein [Pseudomonas syringae pv. syringae]RXT88596.1 hypothetical protein B1F69_19320 [Pseudomonas syringae]
MWNEFWKFLSEHNGALGLILSLATAAFALNHYFSIKRSEEQARKFANFHQLLQDLNEGKPKPNGDVGGQYIDRQQAIIYELRSFKEYHPVIVRILNRAIVTWGQSETRYMNVLIDEAQKTLSFIIKYNCRKRWRRMDLAS